MATVGIYIHNYSRLDFVSMCGGSSIDIDDMMPYKDGYNNQLCP